MHNKISPFSVAVAAVIPHPFNSERLRLNKGIALLASACLAVNAAFQIYRTGFSRKTAFFSLLSLVPIAISCVLNYSRQVYLSLLSNRFFKPEIFKEDPQSNKSPQDQITEFLKQTISNLGLNVDNYITIGQIEDRYTHHFSISKDSRNLGYLNCFSKKMEDSQWEITFSFTACQSSVAEPQFLPLLSPPESLADLELLSGCSVPIFCIPKQSQFLNQEKLIPFTEIRQKTVEFLAPMLNGFFKKAGKIQPITSGYFIQLKQINAYNIFLNYKIEGKKDILIYMEYKPEIGALIVQMNYKFIATTNNVIGHFLDEITHLSGICNSAEVLQHNEGYQAVITKRTNLPNNPDHQEIEVDLSLGCIENE